MPFYIEDPYQRITNVHWKKKKPDDPPDTTGSFVAEAHCGAYMNGLQGGVHVGISGVLVLANTNLYYLQTDFRPHHLPNKPNWYVPIFDEYIGMTPFRPFVWANPIGWTLTYGLPGQHDVGLRISEYRNVNPQKLLPPASLQVLDPTRRVEGTGLISMNINDPASDVYPPMFICEFFAELDPADPWTVDIYPRVLVQAHCCPMRAPHEADPCTETTGYWFGGTEENAQIVTTFLPEQPPGWGTAYSPDVFYKDPADGSADLPLYPPMGRSRRVAPPILPSGF